MPTRKDRANALNSFCKRHEQCSKLTIPIISIIISIDRNNWPIGAIRSGAMWDPEELLPAYAALRDLIELHRPSQRKSVEIIDGEHGFYTVCPAKP